jgi:hypothetical protein
MDSSTPTEELAIGGAPESASMASTELHHLTSATIRQGCAACGAAMAADQRYCVECGERRGAPRVSLLEGPAQRPRESAPQSAPSSPRRRIATVNSTLISIIGMLLLAVGVGVLIGRSGDTTVKSPPAQVVTISGAPSTGAAATTPATSTGATTASESSTAAKAKSKASTKTKPAASKVPLPKAVKVGTPGHGRGYQNGHFTGNFFGE